MSRYRYTPIKAPNTIRLLKLRPCKQKIQTGHSLSGDLALEGSLQEHPIHDDTSFDCLSYTWGEPKFEHAIFIDGGLLPITKNLDRALRSVQDVAETSFLWVDAICIDQENLEERAQQVQLMRKIYSTAAQVLAYLGPEGGGSQDVPSICRRIFEGVEKFQQANPINRELEDNILFPDTVALKPFELLDKLDWGVLTRLLARSWFVRVWIVQEAVVARKLTFVCGKWNMIAEALFYVVTFGVVHNLPLSSWGAPERRAARQGISQILFMLDLIKMRLARNGKESNPNLLDLLGRSRHQDATDPRDNVYALLGLSQEQTIVELQPDYTEELQDTYRRYATYFIEAGQGADLLELVDRNKLQQGFPSWIPNWSFPHVENQAVSPKNDLAADNANRYAQAGGDRKNFTAKVDGRRLIAKSYMVDVIERTGLISIQNLEHLDVGTTQRLNHTSYAFLESLVRYIEEAARFLNLEEGYPTSEHKGEVLFKTLICNRKIGTAEEAPKTYRSFVESFILLLLVGSVSQSGVINLLQRFPLDLFGLDLTSLVGNHADDAINEHLRHASLFTNMLAMESTKRRPCLSKKGYIGMFPLTAQVGDTIFVIAGAPIPFLLRPKGDAYELLGQCYVHGIMKGEALAGHKSQDITIV